MRHLRLLTLLCLTAVPAFAACSAPAADDGIGEESSELVQFPAAAFAGAPLLAYGGIL